MSFIYDVVYRLHRLLSTREYDARIGNGSEYV